MPKFFFHIKVTGLPLIKDEEGEEFSSIEDAEQEARKSIQERLGPGALESGGVLRRLVEIADETGKVVKSVPYSTVVAIPPKA